MYDLTGTSSQSTGRMKRIEIGGLDGSISRRTIIEQAAERARLNILLVRMRLLHPLNTGGRVRTAKMLEQLGEHNDVTLVTYRYAEDSDYDLERTARLCKRLVTVPHEEAPRHSPRFFLELAGSFLRGTPHAVSRYNNRRMAQTVAKLYARDDYDLVICDYLQSCEGLRGLRNVPFVLFAHNIETAVCEQFAGNTPSLWRRLYLKYQASRMRAYERRQCQRAAHVIACSDLDREILESEFGAQECSYVPTGVDLNYYQPGSQCLVNNIVFTGAMDSRADQDAVLHFVKDIYPQVQCEIPSVALTIVGRKPPREIVRLGEQPGIHVTGTVNDVRPYIRGSKVFVLPMRVGSGTRVKLLEAMAMGKAIVSTSIGAEGLPLDHNRHVVLADDPRSFARECVSLLRDNARRNLLETNARQLVERDYSWHKVGKLFSEICYQAATQQNGTAA